MHNIDTWALLDSIVSKLNPRQNILYKFHMQIKIVTFFPAQLAINQTLLTPLLG